MNLENLIQYIENKIQGYKINAHGKLVIENLYKKYNFDLLIECVDISAEYYLIFDENDFPTKESVENFFDKIGGIAYNKSLSPVEQKINHVMNYGRKIFYDWRWNEAKLLLKRYVSKLKEFEYSDEEIIENLNDYVMLIMEYSQNWRHWYNSIKEQIEQMN